MSNVTKHPASAGPGLFDDQLIGGDDYDRLWRAQQAVQLLATINNMVAAGANISHDSTAAVAEYIRDGMLEILNQAQPATETR